MTIDAQQMIVGGLTVDVIRKAIKNLHVGVYPPDGRVRVAAPLGLSDDAVRLAVVTRIAWIHRQRARFEAQPRQSVREMVSGESHYVLGQRYRLRVTEHDAPPRVAIAGGHMLDLSVRPGTGPGQRQQILHEWYRAQLKEVIPPFIEKWLPVLGVSLDDWRIKRMKTRWGTCNVEARRIWLNLELAKKPVGCVEYVIVHELAHLRAPGHDDAFVALLDDAMPQWRHRRDELNQAPLAHESWPPRRLTYSRT